MCWEGGDVAGARLRMAVTVALGRAPSSSRPYLWRANAKTHASVTCEMKESGQRSAMQSSGFVALGIGRTGASEQLQCALFQRRLRLLHWQ